MVPKLTWQSGRQESGYEKMLLAQGSFPLPFDLWLLRYPEGSEIDWHNDPVEKERKHYRLNVLLKKAKKGGEFESAVKPLLDLGRAVLFRPDINRHRVLEIEEGTRYVLSLGWLGDQ